MKKRLSWETRAFLGGFLFFFIFINVAELSGMEPAGPMWLRVIGAAWISCVCVGFAKVVAH